MAGGGSKDSSTEPLSEIVPVFLGLEPHQRQAKAVLAANLPVTASPIASMAGEERHDFIDESNRNHRVVSCYVDLSLLATVTFHGRADRRRSILKGAKVSGLVDFDNTLRDGLIGGGSRQVTVGVGQNQLMPDVRPNKRDGTIFAPLGEAISIAHNGCEEEAGEQTDTGKHEDLSAQNNGSGLPSQIMKGRPSRSWSSARWSIPIA